MSQDGEPQKRLLRSWKELSVDEQEIWNEIGRKNTVAIFIIKEIVTKGCPECKKQLSSWPAVEFHYQSTHGIPREDLIETITKYEVV